MGTATELGFRLDKLGLFKDLGYEPHAGQLAVHVSEASRRVLACGVRWGKTHCAAMEALAACLEPRERSVGWIVGPTYDLCDRVFGQVQYLLRKHLEHRIVEHSGRERLLVVRNLGGGLSEVRGKSADHPSSLLGEGLDWLVLDEAARLKRSVWEGHLSQRLLDREGWALLLSTPRGRGWFYELYRRGQKDDPEYSSWNSPTSDSPLIKPEAIERERLNLPRAVFAQEYLAEFLEGETSTCDRCGDPRPDGKGLVVLLEGEELRRCEDCGSAIGEDGRALGMLSGTRSALKVVIRASSAEAA